MGFGPLAWSSLYMYIFQIYHRRCPVHQVLSQLQSSPDMTMNSVICKLLGLSRRVPKPVPFRLQFGLVILEVGLYFGLVQFGVAGCN